MSRAAAAFLLSVLLMSPQMSISDPGVASDDRSSAPASATLTVSVTETPDAVRLRIQASGEFEPGSVDLQFAGRKAVVLARDAEGRPVRSEPVRLPAAVIEEGASATYDTEDALVITLRKRPAAAPGDSEAAAP